MLSAADAVRRRDAIEAEIRRHKAEIRRRREQLWLAKSSLLRLERECALHGIKLVVTGEGRIPWPKRTDPSSTSTP